MKRFGILFWILIVATFSSDALAEVTVPDGYADANYFLDKTITADEYNRVYFVIYNDRISKEGKFTDEELTDIVDYFKSMKDGKDLSDGLYTTGPKSNEVIGAILLRGGAVFGTKSGPPQAVYWCKDGTYNDNQPCCQNQNNDPGYCWPNMRCNQATQLCEDILGGCTKNSECPAGQVCVDGECIVKDCSDHDQCSQACTTQCPYGVFGCCDGCLIGQCSNGRCICQESTNYCGNSPRYQVGTECSGGTNKWCYDALTDPDNHPCCVDQDSKPRYCWEYEECDEQTQTCVDSSSVPVCGNGICEKGETSQNCPYDCPTTASCTELCKQDKDAGGKNFKYAQCWSGASACKFYSETRGDPDCVDSMGDPGAICCCDNCGDGVCDPGESTLTCPKDCSTATKGCQELCRNKKDLSGKPFSIFSCVKSGSVCLFIPEPQGDPDCKNIAQDAGAKCCCSNCGDLTCGPGENVQNCPADCSTPKSCTDHNECSQACTSKCPAGVFGCCDGCKIGQCVKGKCACQDAPSYCKAPVKQVGTECTGGTKIWCYTAVVKGEECCVNQDSDPGYCWGNQICDEKTKKCIDNSIGPVCGDGTCDAGETAQNCPWDCAAERCIDHNDCSQACSTQCPYGVFGCCDGCMIGQCVDGQCACQESQNYCGNTPAHQVGTECKGGTDIWCFNALTEEDHQLCCVNQDSDPEECWTNKYCDPDTNRCV